MIMTNQATKPASKYPYNLLHSGLSLLFYWICSFFIKYFMLLFGKEVWSIHFKYSLWHIFHSSVYFLATKNVFKLLLQGIHTSINNGISNYIKLKNKDGRQVYWREKQIPTQNLKKQGSCVILGHLCHGASKRKKGKRKGLFNILLLL